jgi:peptide/nickel transport system permease protein
MRYALRRTGFFALTLWTCITLNFLLPRLMPGNPAEALLARFHGRINPAALHALEIAFGVNTKVSLWHQYVTYLYNLIHLKFGTSITFFPEPVTHVVMQALPWTLGLVGVTTILAFILGTLIGIVGAWRRGGWLDSILPPVFIITNAIPYYWLAMLMIIVCSLQLHWFPFDDNVNPALIGGWNWSYIGDILDHAILPAASILITFIGGWILTMRNTMITTLSEDYIRMARAKGLPARKIMFDYAARNAILPNLSGFAMSLGFVVSGAVFVEYVFNYNGVGYLLVQALDSEDYPLLQALFLLITIAVLIAILLADLATVIFDPRTRTAG